MAKDEFDNVVHPLEQSQWPQHPPPQELVPKGITTDNTLNWEALRPPKPPAPEPTPNDPVGWDNAKRRAEAEHAVRMAEKRAAFEAKAGEMKADFVKSSHNKKPLDELDR